MPISTGTNASTSTDTTATAPSSLIMVIILVTSYKTRTMCTGLKTVLVAVETEVRMN